MRLSVAVFYDVDDNVVGQERLSEGWEGKLWAPPDPGQLALRGRCCTANEAYS